MVWGRWASNLQHACRLMNITFIIISSIAIHCDSGQTQFVKRIVVILALLIKNHEVSVFSVISGVKTSYSNVLEIRPQP